MPSASNRLSSRRKRIVLSANAPSASVTRPAARRAPRASSSASQHAPARDALAVAVEAAAAHGQQVAVVTVVEEVGAGRVDQPHAALHEQQRPRVREAPGLRRATLTTTRTPESISSSAETRSRSVWSMIAMSPGSSRRTRCFVRRSRRAGPVYSTNRRPARGLGHRRRVFAGAAWPLASIRPPSIVPLRLRRPRPSCSILVCVGSPGTFSTRKWRSARLAICGRCVIVTTCARARELRERLATACAVSPPMPASISSKTIVSPPRDGRDRQRDARQLAARGRLGGRRERQARVRADEERRPRPCPVAPGSRLASSARNSPSPRPSAVRAAPTASANGPAAARAELREPRRERRRTRSSASAAPRRRRERVGAGLARVQLLAGRPPARAAPRRSCSEAPRVRPPSARGAPRLPRAGRVGLERVEEPAQVGAASRRRTSTSRSSSGDLPSSGASARQRRERRSAPADEGRRALALVRRERRRRRGRAARRARSTCRSRSRSPRSASSSPGSKPSVSSTSARSSASRASSRRRAAAPPSCRRRAAPSARHARTQLARRAQLLVAGERVEHVQLVRRAARAGAARTGRTSRRAARPPRPRPRARRSGPTRRRACARPRTRAARATSASSPSGRSSASASSSSSSSRPSGRSNSAST